MDLIHIRGSRHQPEYEKQAERTFDVIHDQTFKCVIEKIFDWSMCPFLKIFLFPCFHSPPITAINTHNQIRLTPKLWEMHFLLLVYYRCHTYPLITLKPNKPGNFARTEKMRRGFVALPTHITSSAFHPYPLPLFTRFRLDTILSSNTLHAVKWLMADP